MYVKRHQKAGRLLFLCQECLTGYLEELWFHAERTIDSSFVFDELFCCKHRYQGPTGIHFRIVNLVSKTHLPKGGLVLPENPWTAPVRQGANDEK